MANPPDFEWIEPWCAEEDSARRAAFEAELRRELRFDHPLFGIPVEMFTFSEHGNSLGAYCGAVIHFGGRFKSIEQEWED